MPKSAQRWVTNLSSSTKLPAIEQRVDALARGQLAGLVLLVDALGAAAERGLRLHLLEPLDRIGPVWSLAHGGTVVARRHGVSNARLAGAGVSYSARASAICGDVANVKGSALASRVLWVRLNHGEAGMERLARQRRARRWARCCDDGAVMARWYPFEQFVELNLAIDRMFGTRRPGLIKKLGRHGADANLTTIYRLFYKVGTVNWILARASRLWSVHYDTGTLHVDMLSRPRGRACASRTSRPRTGPTACRCCGWAERSIELSGGTDVTIAEIACRTRGGPALPLPRQLALTRAIAAATATLAQPEPSAVSAATTASITRAAQLADAGAVAGRMHAVGQRSRRGGRAAGRATSSSR